MDDAAEFVFEMLDRGIERYHDKVWDGATNSYQKVKNIRGGRNNNNNNNNNNSERGNGRRRTSKDNNEDYASLQKYTSRDSGTSEGRNFEDTRRDTRGSFDGSRSPKTSRSSLDDARSPRGSFGEPLSPKSSRTSPGDVRSPRGSNDGSIRRQSTVDSQYTPISRRATLDSQYTPLSRQPTKESSRRGSSVDRKRKGAPPPPLRRSSSMDVVSFRDRDRDGRDRNSRSDRASFSRDMNEKRGSNRSSNDTGFDQRPPTPITYEDFRNNRRKT